MKTNIFKTAIATTSALALTLAMFGCAPAPEPEPEPETETPQIGIKLNIEAEGFNPDTSTPVIAAFTEADYEEVFVCAAGEEFATIEEADAHVAEHAAIEDAQAHATYVVAYKDEAGNKVEPVTTYEELKANEEQTVELNEGKYTLELISPINADGAIYIVPETTEVEAKEITDDAEVITLTLIPAEEVTPEQIESVVAGITLAVQAEDGLGDEALLERAVANAQANPNVTPEEVEAVQEEAQAAVESGNTQAVANMAAAQPARDTSGNTTNKTNASAGVQTPAASTPSTSNSGSNSNAGSNNASTPSAQPSQPAHTHNYNIPITETTQKKVVDQPATSGYAKCLQCGKIMHSQAEISAHQQSVGRGETHNYTTIEGTPEKSHMETVTTTVGYKCSCGATK